jgi:uncharacterized membrane protein YfcA
MESFPVLFPIASYWARLQGLSLHLDPWAVLLMAFLLGGVTGFFGVGGRLMTVPLLHVLFRVPYNVAVGSDLGQMAGITTMNLFRFKRMSRIDFKLTFFMLVGTIPGLEAGVRILERLKGAGALRVAGITLPYLSLVMALIYGTLLAWIGWIIFKESKGPAALSTSEGTAIGDPPTVTARLQHIKWPPRISLPVSGIEAISFWVIMGVGGATGLLLGLLGAGGGFIRLPALIYVIGCPMVVAIGTDLFEGLITLAYGVLTHSLKGNIDLFLTLCLLIGISLGGQVGGVLAKRFADLRLKKVFAFLAFSVAVLGVVEWWF